MFKNTADFDISTLIYILLAVVAFVSSIFQKKKQLNQNPNPEQKGNEPNWKDLFDDPDPEPEPEPEPFREIYKKTEAFEQKETKTPQPVFIDKNDELFRSKSMESYVENEASIIGSIGKSYEYEDVIKQTEIKEVGQERKAKEFEFDLEKAVIYSEIIQRKY